MVNAALKAGTIQRQKCEICGKLPHRQPSRFSARGFPQTVAHHSNYFEPLNVTWLCLMHHAEWHKLFIAEGA